MPATNYPEFNAAVTELTDRVELLLTDVGKMQSVASVQVAADKAAEASTSATAAASSATAANGSKTAAASSATAAASSATAANTSKVAAASSATAADGSKTAAAASATTASTAATNAGNSATAADASKVAAANSATAADSSKTAAAGSATAASSSSTKASQWADAAENTVVETGKYSAKHHAAKAAASATAAANSATSASTAKLAAESARDQAVTAASALTGSLSELGSIDLSSGVYPAKPAIAAFWKVTVGGTAGGVTYGVGDTLVYSKNLDQFYKIDNTESVSSVNGATGAVAITPASISAQPTHANLTALSGLTGAADKLPYFTGAGALSVATLTAKARELLGAVDAAGMRTTLGLGTAATKNVGTSSGDVVEVGAFGLGYAKQAGDFATRIDSGFYLSTSGSTGQPSGMVLDGGWMINLNWAANGVGNKYNCAFYGNVQNNFIGFRRVNQLGEPQAPVAIYHTGNICGLVSQSGGLPTGAIIESGSNANGKYTKFADGTMICTHHINNGAVEYTAMGGVAVSPPFVWTYPVQFAANPRVSGLGSSQINNYQWLSATLPSVGSVPYRTLIPSASTSSNSTVDLVAIGRWY